jgi:hypothetical protein
MGLDLGASHYGENTDWVFLQQGAEESVWNYEGRIDRRMKTIA